MPLKQCTQDGRSGWQWGDAGTCYTGPQARQRALRQAAAIRASGYTGNARRPTQADLDAPAVGTKANPLALDPTRTTLLRRRYMAEMNKRFRALRGAIWRTIVQEDALGLGKAKPFIFQANAAAELTTNNKWAFLSDPDKAEAFQDWFEQQVQQDVFAPIPGAAPLTPADLAEPVPVVDPSAPWQAEFVESAYMKGVTQAYADTHAEAMHEGRGRVRTSSHVFPNKELLLQKANSLNSTGEVRRALAFNQALEFRTQAQGQQQQQ